ncbi:histamine H1 receptor-like [Stylophora pistillata]|uniref:histamine H1 receptor-like n=1 Tax=Stylophora pistillata TaxID=50429 RepID=UPI000C0496F3|nr:histamine H1 receptor-like [Stylophora pistillata]
MSTEDPVKSRNSWIVVFIAESIVIVMSNALTLLVFAKIRHLRKCSTYLIMNLAVADLLVGALTVPTSVLYFFYEDENQVTPSRVAKTVITFVFPLASQLNLCLISTERLHATLLPFRHCLFGKRFYFRTILGSWLINFVIASIMAWLDIADFHPEFLYVHGALVALFVVFIAVSHIIVFLKIQSSRHSPPCSSIRKERKLTVTLFIATAVSVLTILPFAVNSAMPGEIQDRVTTFPIHIDFAFVALYNLSSMVNPFVYAIRLQEFRGQISKLIRR